MSEPTDWIQEATRVGVELKESIREAHGLLKDLRELRREIQVLQRTIVEGVAVRAREEFNRAFTEGLDDYTNGLLRQTDKAFDDLEKMTEASIEHITQSVRHMMEEFAAGRKPKLL